MEAPMIVIVGAGSVGMGLYAYLIDHANWNRIELHDPPKEKIGNIADADIIHITVPYLDQDQYLLMFHGILAQITTKNPMIIIHSTLNPLTLEKIAEIKYECYYVPIRVSEANMPKQIGYHTWLYACLNQRDTFHIEGYLNHLNIHYSKFSDPFALAYGKLMETTRTGMEIAFTQMMQRVCEEHGWNFDDAYANYTTFSSDRTDYRKNPNLTNIVARPVFFPGKIGGKCIMQNLKIVDDNHLADLNFIEFILDSNDKVKE